MSKFLYNKKEADAKRIENLSEEIVHRYGGDAGSPMSAWQTSALHLLRTVEIIDLVLGEGYAEQHPELIGTFVQTIAQVDHTAIMEIASQARNAAIKAVADAIQECAAEMYRSRDT